MSREPTRTGHYMNRTGPACGFHEPNRTEPQCRANRNEPAISWTEPTLFAVSTNRNEPKRTEAFLAKHVWKWKRTKHTRVRPLLGVEMSKKCTPLWREANLDVKMYKTYHVRTTFGSCDAEKVHGVVARSAFWVKHIKKITSHSDHFWTSRYRPAAEKAPAFVARSPFPSPKC